MAIREIPLTRWYEIMDGAEKNGAAEVADIHNGYSPGGAAAEMGISRQAIMAAIKRGSLDALRVPTPSGTSLWFIHPDALERYRNSPNQKHAIRYEYE